MQGYKSNWPSTISDFHESYGYNEASVRLGPPSARHIPEMGEALQWMMLLTIEPEYTRKFVWLRINGVRWKAPPRPTLRDEQDHLNALATALGIDTPDPGIAD